MTLDEFIKELKKYLDKDMVVFTGAGLSTASGIKDFRGKNGLYKENINAEEILSHYFFMENPTEFYEFYRDKLINNKVKPNLMHKVIANLQKRGVVSGVITQNIDGLDTMAGSSVVELHGNANKFYCMDCNKEYDLKDIEKMDMVPKCSCGGIIKPHVVLYEESLNNDDLIKAEKLISNAKSLLVLGSTLKVNPAASLVYNFVLEKIFDKNKKLFIVNIGPTDYDYFADYKYDGDIIEVAKKIKEEI